MARRVMGMNSCLAVALVSILIIAPNHVSAQSSSCTTAIVSLASCLSYITGSSTTPTSSCCTSLAGVVKTQARCLCTLLNSGAAQFGLNINQTLALALPGACKVQTPPLSQCNAAAPAASPAEAPSAPATPTVPATPSIPATSTPTPAASVPAGKGSNIVPSPTGESSDASSLIKLTRSVIFSALFAVACVSSLVV